MNSALMEHGAHRSVRGLLGRGQAVTPGLLLAPRHQCSVAERITGRT